MEIDKFNPVYPIGKTVKEAKEYLKKYDIIYSFENDESSNFQLAIARIYKEGTHLYKCYNYNITNPDDRIITSFNGVTGKSLNSFCAPSSPIGSISINSNGSLSYNTY